MLHLKMLHQSSGSDIGRVPNLWRKVLRNGAFLFLGNSTSSLCMFLSNILIVRWLSKEDFALYVLVISITYLMIGLGNTALPITISKLIASFLARNERPTVEGLIRGSFVIALTSAALCFVAVWGLAGFFAQATNLQAMRFSLQITSVWIACQILMSLVGGVLNGFERMQYSSVVLNAFETAKFVGVLTALALRVNLIDLLRVQSGMVFITTILVMVFFYKFLKTQGFLMKNNRENFRLGVLFKKCLLFFPGVFIPQVVYQIVFLMLGWLNDPKEVAHMAVALPLTALPLSVVGPFMYAALPAIAAQFEKTANPIRAFGNKFLSFISALSVSMALLYFFFGARLIVLIYGAPYAGLQPLVTFLAIAFCFESLSSVADFLLKGASFEKMTALIEMGKLLFIFLLGIPWAKRSGAEGMAWAILTSFFVTMGVRFYFLKKHLRVGGWSGIFSWEGVKACP